MTTNVQHFLTAFDALTPPEKQEAVVEMLRRISTDAPRDFPDEALTSVADGLFAALDTEEAGNAGP